MTLGIGAYQLPDVILSGVSSLIPDFVRWLVGLGSLVRLHFNPLSAMGDFRHNTTTEFHIFRYEKVKTSW